MYDVPKLLQLLSISAIKSGSEYQGKCPIHADNDPSWHIEEESGRWYCFGCCSGGGPVALVTQLLNISSKEARKWLFENGISTEEKLQLPAAITVVTTGRSYGNNSFKMPPDVRFGILPDWPSPIKKYIQERKIADWQVDCWSLGYATEGRLGGRVVFPIVDCEGNLCSYTARTYVGGTPKYLTPSPEENPADTACFGEKYWPYPQDRATATLVLTEGAINALACERAGAMFVVALGGSPMAPLDGLKKRNARISDGMLAIVSKLSKFKRILLATDPDTAGEKVVEALRSLSRWAEVSRVNIPKGKDANDLETQQLRGLLMEAGLK